jgi:glutaminase
VGATYAYVGSSYVSIGHLPTPELVTDAYARYKPNTEGENSQVYPALAAVPSDLFGVCVVGTSGSVYAVGDTDFDFSIMSVSKPFAFALVCQTIGAEQARATQFKRLTCTQDNVP